MARINIPMTALRHIANELIETDPRPRTHKWRPKSKVAILRSLMKQDPQMYGRVVARYREMQAAKLAVEMEANGVTVKPVEPKTAGDDEPFDLGIPVCECGKWFVNCFSLSQPERLVCGLCWRKEYGQQFQNQNLRVRF